MLGRYFKFTSNGSSVNESNHCVEVQIVNTDGKNVALGKGAFWVSNIGDTGLRGDPAQLTDGDTTSYNYFDLGPGEQSFIIDVGEIVNATYVKVWRYWLDGRKYLDVSVAVSLDNESYETVFSSAVDGIYSESSSGKQIDLLPSQEYSGSYQILEYIQSSAAQYINTEVIPNGTTNAEIKYSVQEIMNAGPHILSAADWFTAFPRKRDSDKAKVFAVFVGAGFTFLDAESIEDEVYTVKTIPGEAVIINGTAYPIGEAVTADTKPVYMFTYGGSPSSTYYLAKAKVFSCKIWEGDTLIRDFVPVKLDIGFCGMLDRVNQRFYCNIGTGEFIAGPNFVPTKIIIRSGSTLYTVTDNTLTALTETEVTASLLQTYGVDDLPDGALLATLTDPEVLYWQDSEDELPALSMTVKGTPPLPQMFTSEPMDLTHESIAGIDHAVVDASEDVRFVISFDDGATWKAFDGSAWFDVSDTARGMAPSTMNAITAEQWAEVVRPTAYRLRFWLPNVTAYVASVVIHYINP